MEKKGVGDTMPLMCMPGTPENFKNDFGQLLKWLLPLSIVLIVLMACFYWLLHLECVYKPTWHYPAIARFKKYTILFIVCLFLPGLPCVPVFIGKKISKRKNYNSVP